jgi:hypothetical protein
LSSDCLGELLHHRDEQQEWSVPHSSDALPLVLPWGQPTESRDSIPTQAFACEQHRPTSSIIIHALDGALSISGYGVLGTRVHEYMV